MKKNKLYMASVAFAALSLVTSCDSFLDKLPDDRAEVNTEEKVTSLLVSAYPTASSNLILEWSSDNYADNGKQYSTNQDIEQVYRFQPITAQTNDSPKSLWNGYYSAIAAANQALASIDEMGNPASLKAQRAEALLCRAYSMYRLATTFCMTYNPDNAEKCMGLPYPTKPETTVSPDYKRGTLKQLYEQIDADIEAALPDVSDDIYTQPKYHFNQKAAYAFAARFNLYYMNYDKVITYASKVLGANPASLLRNYVPFMSLSNSEDIENRYISSSENANLLLMTAFSQIGRNISGSEARFCHNQNVGQYETIWAKMPWGSGSINNTLYQSNLLFGNTRILIFPKMFEHFEFIDKINQTGYLHVVDAVFTTDETLLCRAEAYALKKDYDNAVKDINTWIVSHTMTANGTAKRPTMTVESIKTFIENLPYAPVTPKSNLEHSIRKTFHPQGFTVEAGTQEDILQFILQMRRLETLYQGLRFLDIKRYGIEFSHDVDEESPIVFKAGDLRGAIQLPDDVIEAGLPANPREESNK